MASGFKITPMTAHMGLSRQCDEAFLHCQVCRLVRAFFAAQSAFTLPEVDCLQSHNTLNKDGEDARGSVLTRLLLG